MDRETSKSVASGEAMATVAEAWFTFFGFVAVTAVFHGLNEKVDNLAIFGIKWTCYALMFNWLRYKIVQLLSVLYPSSSLLSDKPRHGPVILGATLSSLLMGGAYFLIAYVIHALVQHNAA